MGAALNLPDCRLARAEPVWRNGIPWEQMFCASCHKPGPMVISPPEDRGFAFYLCDAPADCATKYGAWPEGIYLVPPSEHNKLMLQEMQEKYGRVLAHHELLDVLGDPHSTLAKLAKEKH